MKRFNNILVIGGGGYIGAVLVPKLLKAGYQVKVYDLFIYGEDVFNDVKDNAKLTIVKGDVRDIKLLQNEIRGIDAIIHLACISNDPSYKLNSELSKSINFDCFEPGIKAAKSEGVKRFIYISSSSVYGVKEKENVTEDLPLEPLTDYSKYKALCEEIVLKESTDNFICLVLRPATVCGYSPRQRLDLSVNILTNHAVNKGKITVFGGPQKRPNIHIQDITDLYVKTLEYEDNQISNKVFNAGYENMPLMEIAKLVQKVIGNNIEIAVERTDDLRSYHISSEKIKKELGYTPKHTIEDAVLELKQAFEKGLLKDPLNNSMYYNIKRMKEINLK